MAEINVRKRGSKWEYRFEGAKINGNRNQITKGGFITKKVCLEAGAKALAEYNNAGLRFTPSEISFSDYLDYWMKEYCEINLKKTTCEGYEKKIRIHIKPALGIYKLKALTPAVLQLFTNSKFNDGYSRNTLASIKGILSGCLGYAIEPLGFIQSNPMLAVKLPSPRAVANTPTRKKEKQIVNKETMEAILTRFPEGHSCHIPLQLAYRCGLRLGEVFALTWNDIDFANSTLDINKQVQEQDKYWTFTNPKYDSFRVIKIDSFLMSLLQREKARQEKAKEYYADHYSQLYVNEKKQLGSKGTPIWMVNIREDGTYIQPRVTQHLGRVVHYQLGNKEFDYHSLRHTHTTMLLEAGANIKDVQHRLGHKNIETTLQTYAHVTEKMQIHTINILEDILK
jgi:integrase